LAANPAIEAEFRPSPSLSALDRALINQAERRVLAGKAVPTSEKMAVTCITDISSISHRPPRFDQAIRLMPNASLGFTITQKAMRMM
jgi:hypothetical protein